MSIQHFLPTDYANAPFSQHLSKFSRKFLKRDAVLLYLTFQGIYTRSQAKRDLQKRELIVDKEMVVETEKRNRTPKADHTYSKNLSVRRLVEKLKRSKMVSDKSEGTLINNFGHMTTEVFGNEIKNNTKLSGSWYSDQIKEFAVSPHYYSPRAYRFVRKYLSLPHSATICSWSAGIECEPGVLEKPLLYIADLVKDGQKDCALIIDEIDGY